MNAIVKEHPGEDGTFFRTKIPELARQLYTAAKDAGLPVTLTTQEHTRHQFPEKPYTLEDILSPERQMCI